MSLKLQRRRKQLATVLLFLNRLTTNVRYRNDDISQIVFNLADDELSPLKNAENNQYESIIETLNFNSKDKDLLISFFKDLGKTDIEGVLSHIKMYEELFSEQYENAKEDILNKGKLYRMLGLFSGLAFVVLFI